MIEALELEHLSDFGIRFANSHPFRVRLTKFLHQNLTNVRNAGDFAPFSPAPFMLSLSQKLRHSKSPNFPTLRLARLFGHHDMGIGINEINSFFNEVHS